MDVGKINEGTEGQGATGTSDGNVPTSDDNVLKSDENVPTSDGNVPTSDENIPTSEEQQTKPDEMFSMDWLRKYMAKSMGIYYGPEPVKLLDEVSFEGIARYIKSGNCQKIVTMVGAGISTSAGLPDFRTPGSGMYTQLEKYNLTSPQQAFDINFFKDNPEPYYMIRRDMFAAQVKPTPCHYFVKMLEMKNKLLRHFTQNIDGLERDAGISEERLVEAHGSYRTSHCMTCKKQFGRDWCIDKMFEAESPVPHCDVTDCNGVIKPDVVFFGQSLPKRFAERVPDIDACDLLLIMGTSLVVQPFNTLTTRTQESTPRLYINMENKVGGKRHPISVLFFGGGFDFDQEDNIRDVYWQGACDDGCMALADLIGWGAELREMIKTEHDRIDNEWRLSGKVPKVLPVPKVTTSKTVPKKDSSDNKQKTPTRGTASVGNMSASTPRRTSDSRTPTVQGSKGPTRTPSNSKSTSSAQNTRRSSNTPRGSGLAHGGRSTAQTTKK